MRDPNQKKKNKMAGVNSRFEMSIKSTLDGFLLEMSRWSVVVEITSCAYTKTNYSFRSVATATSQLDFKE